MSEWIARVMTAAVLSAVLELLAPDGRMRRYVSFGIASVLLLVLLSPLGGLGARLPSFSLLPDLDGAETESGDAADTVVLQLAETALVSHLAERFSLDGEQIRVTLSYGEDQSILRLRILLPQGAPIEAIRAYLASETSCECEVIVYQS